ncbi:TraR/DksA family transcriptional regulator [Aquitalea sp. ASV11]|uniref:TraR/DksA family transcriptional regulator n=1 Tax=Aquitalea sp. ASV11 TaxID=2795103 RepID=UPI0018EC1250|nr:TraR/DksA family transcriptional regulator [Aquitalea sp. ASV11]
MTDFYDRAQELEQKQRDAALRHQEAASRPLGASLTHCDDCGKAIPQKRREASPGCTRCISCQTLAERHRR